MGGGWKARQAATLLGAALVVVGGMATATFARDKPHLQHPKHPPVRAHVKSAPLPPEATVPLPQATQPRRPQWAQQQRPLALPSEQQAQPQQQPDQPSEQALPAQRSLQQEQEKQPS